jgi:hypothetical protein
MTTQGETPRAGQARGGKPDDLAARVRAFYDDVFPQSVRFIAEGKAHSRPLIIRRTISGEGNEMLIVDTPKEDWAALQQYALDKPDTDFILFLMEAWAVAVDGGKDGETLDEAAERIGAPSEHPDRAEIVGFIFTAKCGARWVAHCKIERPANILHRGELIAEDANNRSEGRILPAVHSGTMH